MKPCLSLAASYSAFSDRSPCARASAIAWMTAGRSTVFSSLQLVACRRSAPSGSVIGNSCVKTAVADDPACVTLRQRSVQFGVQLLR